MAAPSTSSSKKICAKRAAELQLQVNIRKKDFLEQEYADSITTSTRKSWNA